MSNANTGHAQPLPPQRRRLMVPLFWRIFLMIWLAMAITLVAGQLVSRLLIAQEQQSMALQFGLQELGQEAMVIRQVSGEEAAQQFLRNEGRRLGVHLVLAAPGNAQQTNQRLRLPMRIQNRMESHWLPLKPAVIQLADGYQLIAWPRGDSAGWMTSGVLLAINAGFGLVLISLACWLIARRLSRPLNLMEATARAIAAGDKSVRVAPEVAGRRDEIGQLARAFNAMTKQLRGLLERQKQLLRDISHDFRTPLARQRIAIELALDDGGDEALLSSILRQNERLDAMTGQILTLHRLAAQGEQFARQPVALMSVLNEAMQDAAEAASQQDVTCQLTAEDQAARALALGDAGLLQRAFDNILQNALDHTPPGREVQITLAVSGSWINLTIADQGPGVAEDILENLFEPFFRADKSRGGQGWGLGLAIAKDIILAHDGEITARNSESGGLQIVTRLPVFAAD